MRIKNTGKASLPILALSLVVVMLGYGIVMPILPFYVESMGAGGTELGLLVASYAAMRLLFGPVWGGLSDRWGRKPVLMIGVLGYGITMILFGLATKLWMLFAARTLSGVLSSATSPTTMAYISDSTPPEERSRGMGVLGAAVGIGTILGPGLGGLLGTASLSTPFFIAGGLSFLSILLIGLLLPESLPAADRKPAAQKPSVSDSGGRLRRLFRELWVPLLLAFLMTSGMMLFFGIFGLYAEDKFSYGPDQVGVVFMVFGLVMAVSQGALTGPLTKKLGEVRLIRGSLGLAACTLLWISLAPSSFWLIAAISAFTLMASLLSPAVMSLISQRAKTDQGFTMGWSNAVISMGRIVGPAVGGFAYDVFIESPFYLGALLLLAGFFISIWRLGEPE